MFVFINTIPGINATKACTSVGFFAAAVTIFAAFLPQPLCRKRTGLHLIFKVVAGQRILAFHLNPASMQDFNLQNTLVELLTYVSNANGDELEDIRVQCRNLLEQLEGLDSDDPDVDGIIGPDHPDAYSIP